MDGIHLLAITDFDNLRDLSWEQTQTIEHGDTIERASPVWKHVGAGISLTYNHDTKALRVKGSLQKFLKGNNYSGFTYKEFKESVGTLADVLNCKPVDLAVINNEISTTIKHHPIHLLVKGLDSHAFQNMVKPGTDKIYGAECVRTQRRVKIYDKTLSENMRRNKVQVPEGLVQVELLLRSKRLYRGNGFNLPVAPTLNDLIQPEIYHNSYKLLTDMTKRIQIDSPIDWAYVVRKHSLSPSEVAKILTIHDPNVAAYFKLDKFETWKKNKRLYDRVKNDLSEEATNTATEFQKAVAEAVARKFDG